MIDLSREELHVIRQCLEILKNQWCDMTPGAVNKLIEKIEKIEKIEQAAPLDSEN